MRRRLKKDGSGRRGFSPSPPSPMEELNRRAELRDALTKASQSSALRNSAPSLSPLGRGEGDGSNCATTQRLYLATFGYLSGYEINLTAMECGIKYAVLLTPFEIRAYCIIALLINFNNSACDSTALNWGNSFFTFSGAWMRKPTLASSSIAVSL